MKVTKKTVLERNSKKLDKTTSVLSKDVLSQDNQGRWDDLGDQIYAKAQAMLYAFNLLSKAMITKEPLDEEEQRNILTMTKVGESHDSLIKTAREFGFIKSDNNNKNFIDRELSLSKSVITIERIQLMLEGVEEAKQRMKKKDKTHD